MADDDDGKVGLPTGSRLTALDERFREDPYPILRRLREQDPIHEDRELKRWFITDHDVVRAVLRGEEFCVDARKAAADGFARKISGTQAGARPSMLGLDDPDHRRLRSFVSRAFAPNLVEALRPTIERIVLEVLAPLRHRVEFDVIAEFAGPIPFLVLADMLGVRACELREFRDWADAKVQEFDPLRTPATAARIAEADRGLRAYFGRAIAERRAAPRDDLISDLVRANESGESLSEDEIVTMCKLLIIAGIVTTTDLIGNGVLALLRNPVQCTKLREKPELIVGAVEEMLRYDSPVIQTGRIATRDVEIRGRRIAEGASISLSLGAANHDPRVYRDPDRFDIARMDAQHQSFGGGKHLCLGHALARLETQVAVSRLLQTFPRLRLSSVPVARKRLPVLNGCAELRVLTGQIPVKDAATRPGEGFCSMEERVTNFLKISVPVALAALAAVWGIFSPPLAQAQSYHLFADTRPLLAVVNAGDTLSNIAFLVVGLLGLAFLRREHASGPSERFAAPREMRPYWLFFSGVALTSIGSAYYHLAPDDARLVWDRLPMTIAFMSLLAAVVSERISVRAGSLLPWPLVLLGLASVVYWRWSALAGVENLRPYVAVQFGSIAVVLAISILYRSRYTLGGVIFALAAAYGVAKVVEVYDREIFEFGGWVSGHTLKHLAAAAGVVLLLRSLQRRTRR